MAPLQFARKSSPLSVLVVSRSMQDEVLFPEFKVY